MLEEGGRVGGRRGLVKEEEEEVAWVGVEEGEERAAPPLRE